MSGCPAGRAWREIASALCKSGSASASWFCSHRKTPRLLRVVAMCGCPAGGPRPVDRERFAQQRLGLSGLLVLLPFKERREPVPRLLAITQFPAGVLFDRQRFAEERLGLGGRCFALCRSAARLTQAGGNVRVPGREGLVADLHRFAEERLGLGELVLGLQEPREVVQASGDVRVPGRDCCTANLQRLPQVRLGGGVTRETPQRVSDGVADVVAPPQSGPGRFWNPFRL